MHSSYKIKVNKTSTFSLSEEDLLKSDVVENKTGKFHVLHENQSFTAEISAHNFDLKEYTVLVNNKEYRVEIADQLDLLIAEMGFTIGTSKKVNAIEAPMPGLIIEINVIPGQEVEEGDPLLILEAMKMENVISSPRQGVIKTILVKDGDAVNKKELLVEFEK